MLLFTVVLLSCMMALSHLKAIMDCYRPPNMSNGFEVDRPGFLPVGGYCATPKNLIKGIPTWYAVAMAQLEPGPTDPSYWYSCDNNSTMKTSCCTPPSSMVGFPPDGTRATYVNAGNYNLYCKVGVKAKGTSAR